MLCGSIIYGRILDIGVSMKKKIFRIRDEVAFRKTVDGSLTIVSPVTDKIVTVNKTASEVWELVDGEQDVDKIVQVFVSRHRDDDDFPGESEGGEHVVQILEELLKREFIEQVEI